MITMLIYGCKQGEVDVIRKLSSSVIARICDKKLNILVDNLDSEHEPELAVVNICEEGSVDNALKVRERYKDVAILLISNTQISPMKYLNPFIHPLSLLIRPYEEKELYQVLLEFIEKIIDEDEDGIWIDTCAGKVKALFSNILYFEANNKMLNVRLESVEYSIYGSLDQYEKRLPSFFSRCHRGVIVNTRFIERIRFSENYIKLKNGEHIPLSRSYKQDCKEMITI